MERKKALSLAAMSVILIYCLPFSVPLISSTPDRYIVMGGYVNHSDQLGAFAPSVGVIIPFKPNLMGQDITFSAPNPITGIITLTVPAQTYIGVSHTWYDTVSNLWFRLSVALVEDGSGWLFTGTGSSPILGDIDCYTFNNNNGVYWAAPSRLAGQLAAAPGALPSPGPDGIPGTQDDGFGDGTPDPVGSSVLLLQSLLTVDYWDGSAWAPLFVAPWPQVFTTAVAQDTVIEPQSQLNGISSTETGEPWEFLAGRHGFPPVPLVHPRWNAFVTYVCAWSVLEVQTALGPLDTFFEIKEFKVRADLVIPDINVIGGDLTVDIFDLVTCAVAYGAGEQVPPPIDKRQPDPNYNSAADLRPDGLIDIFDLVIIATNYGNVLTP